MRAQMDIFVAQDSREAGEVFVLVGRTLLTAGRGIWRLQLSANGVKKENVFKTEAGVPSVRAVDGGRAIVAITESRVMVVNKNPEGEWLAPRSYPMAFPLTCMDVHVATKKRKGKQAEFRTGHVVVGDKNGAIYILHDIVLKKPHEAPQSVKMHWHRRAVSAVKWALDGESLEITQTGSNADNVLQGTISCLEVWRQFWLSGNWRRDTSNSFPTWVRRSTTLLFPRMPPRTPFRWQITQ